MKNPTRLTPKPNRPSDFSPKSARNLLGQVSECHPKVFIKTFGCQMNVRDSEVIAGLLKEQGFTLTNDPKKADIIIFNTCSVRQHAEDKVWSEIGRLAKLNKKKPLIGVVGCMAQNYKETIFERSPHVDFAVGPTDIAKIPEIITRLLDRPTFFETKIWETDATIKPQEIYHTGYYQDKNHAYVVISEGCSNFCSYCVVPFVRGPLRNRRLEDILQEIKEAVGNGITKITLLGQNVNSYISQKTGDCFVAGASRNDAAQRISFIELLKMVNSVWGLKEFSFITSHPKDTTVELFETMAQLDKLKKYLHLPVQSGSDRILRLMNRGYTRTDYKKLTKAYRKIVKGAALSTDIIVGFPTETEEDFQDTHDLVKEIQFDSAYIFKYSTRPHTKAEKMSDDVPKREKERRHALVLELQKRISRTKK